MNRRIAKIMILLAATTCGCDRSPPVDVKQVQAAWISSGATFAETDSLAACRTQDGRVCVYATCKTGHRIDVFDASSGTFLRSIGHEGDAPGEFRRPNGIVAVNLPIISSVAADSTTHPSDREAGEPFILVVERDNARVQALRPDGAPAGILGHDQLSKPYGAAVSYKHGDVRLYVTDTHTSPDACVKIFRLRLVNGEVRAEFIRAFGEKKGQGVVVKTESIVVDDQLDRVLVCDEDKSGRNVKVFTGDGRFTGTTFADGYIRREPEGLVLMEQPGEGVVIVTDQQTDVSIWHVFDRRDYRHIAAFTGRPAIANTDGICLFLGGFEGFPHGALFAVNNDTTIHAYRLDDIEKIVIDAAGPTSTP